MLCHIIPTQPALFLREKNPSTAMLWATSGGWTGCNLPPPPGPLSSNLVKYVRSIPQTQTQTIATAEQ